jgi:PAS domain S-box-containing protein
VPLKLAVLTQVDINILIISSAITLQLVAVSLGVRLVLCTGKRIAGALIITTISLMAFRRAISLYRLLYEGPFKTDTLGESTGLLISLLMVIGVLYLTRLILSEQRTYSSLASNERRYRLLAENIGDLIFCHSPNGGLNYISPSCREMYAFEPDELIGKNPYELFHPDDMEKIRQAYTLLEPSPAIRTESVRMRHHDGHYVWVEI